MTRRGETFYQAMREALSGATIRALADIRDAGEAFLARVVPSVGELHYNTDGDADAWIEYVDELNGHPGIARLFIPGGILFSLPEEDDTCMVVHPRDIRTRGASYLFHGDGGIADRFPSWFATKVGLFTKKILRLESSSEAVEVQSGSGKDIVLNAGTAKVGRVGDQVKVTIPANTVIVAVASGVGTLNALAIELTGTIQAGADHVKA